MREKEETNNQYLLNRKLKVLIADDEKNMVDEIISNLDIENEETKLLKLQKQYRSGEIKEEELTQEQVNSLCALYAYMINK